MESEAMFFDSLGVSLYADMTVGYSLRVLKSWEWACLSLVRSTDSAVAYIYFDDNDVISLNSLISTVGAEETPSATTLGTWIGTANADIGNLYGQTANGVFDSGFTLTSELTSRRPLFIENGIIKTNNGVASMYFDGTKSFIKDNSLGVTALDSGNPFTVLSVSANEVIAGLGTVFCTNKISSNRVLQFQDRRTVKRATFIKTLSGDYAADLSAQQDSGNTRLLTTVMDNSKNFDSYFNATFQTSNTYLGDYANNNLVVGAQLNNGSPLSGYISEIIMFPTDKTSDLTELHNDINNYYTIY